MGLLANQGLHSSDSIPLRLESHLKTVPSGRSRGRHPASTKGPVLGSIPRYGLDLAASRLARSLFLAIPPLFASQGADGPLKKTAGFDSQSFNICLS